MSHHLLTFNQAVELLGITPGELRHLAVQGDISCEMRGEQMMFRQEELDLWSSRHIIQAKKATAEPPLKPLKERRIFKKLSELCPRECISAALCGTTRASIINALAELADNSGFLYNPDDLKDEITKREEAGSTNIGCGIAIPHPLVRDEGVFSDSFICIAKLARPSFFNSADDGLPTELLILSCSSDSEEHLHILRQISTLCRATQFMQRYKTAETDDELYEALIQSEEELEKTSHGR